MIKGSKMTEASKQKMSESQKNRYATNPVSERTKQKLREKIVSEETRKKHSDKMKEYCKLHPRSSELKKSMGAKNIGRKASIETRMLLSSVHKGNKNSIGKHHSIETRLKLSKFRIGNKYASGHHHVQSDAEKKRKHDAMVKHWQDPEFYSKHLAILNAARKAHPFTEETKQKMSASAKGKHSEHQKAYRKTEEGKANLLKAFSLIKRVSKPQRELFELLKTIFPDAQLEYLITTTDGWRWADIAVPSLKLDFEYDGAYWHDKEKDDKRDAELAEAGWITFRVSQDSLKTLSKTIKEKTIK